MFEAPTKVTTIGFNGLILRKVQFEACLSRMLILLPYVGPGPPRGGVGVLVGYGGHKTAVSVYVIVYSHEALVAQPDVVCPLYTAINGGFLVPVVVVVLSLVHVPVEVVLGEIRHNLFKQGITMRYAYQKCIQTCKLVRIKYNNLFLNIQVKLEN